MRAVLVPVKAFRLAKIRLAKVLDDDTREKLARELAEIVVAAAHGTPVYVVCDDGQVADWAPTRGATVLYAPGLGLSAAVETGVAHLAAQGFSLAVVAHADLPFVTDLSEFGSRKEVTLAPDSRRDGTNVAAVPTGAGFHFSYGPGSFQRHRREAERLGLGCTIVEDWRLSSDIDLPEDLPLLARAAAAPIAHTRGPRTTPATP